MKIYNLIVIKGGAYDDIKKALRQWIVLYSKDIQDSLTFKIYKNGSESHLIQADEQLDNERFYYLINYLKYPEEIKYKIDIEGFTTGNYENKLKGKELLVYIPPNDKDYDNVFVTTSENENFKVEFGGKITEVSEKKIFIQPTDLIFSASETIFVDKKQNHEKETVDRIDKLSRRFKVISAIIFSAYILTFLILNSSENFLTANDIIGYAILGWFIFDYKILQIDRLYFVSVALGMTIFIYGYCLKKEFSQNDKSVNDLVVSTMPIFFLILQRPLRFAFKGIMKREPVVDNPAPSIADFVYIFILIMLTLLIPIFMPK